MLRLLLPRSILVCRTPDPPERGWPGRRRSTGTTATAREGPVFHGAGGLGPAEPRSEDEGSALGIASDHLKVIVAGLYALRQATRDAEFRRFFGSSTPCFPPFFDEVCHG